MNIIRRWLPLIIPFVLVLIADQLSKQWVLDNLLIGEYIAPIPALESVFRITYSRNTGAAFGIFQDMGTFFLIMSVVVTIGVFLYYPRLAPNAHITRWALGLVIGGALGNAIDRIQHGAVIDFISYTIPNVVGNVSNIADHAVVLGVILIFIDMWFISGKTSSPTPTSPETSET